MAPDFGEVVDYLRDARMRQGSEHARLAIEVLDRFLVFDSVAQNHLLAGDGTVGEPRVIGHVHTSHPALAEYLLDTITTVEHSTYGMRLTRSHDILRQYIRGQPHP